jgi:hypothetical protein
MANGSEPRDGSVSPTSKKMRLRILPIIEQLFRSDDRLHFHGSRWRQINILAIPWRLFFFLFLLRARIIQKFNKMLLNAVALYRHAMKSCNEIKSCFVNLTLIALALVCIPAVLVSGVEGSWRLKLFSWLAMSPAHRSMVE